MRNSKMLSVALTLALVLALLPFGAFTSIAAGTVKWDTVGSLPVFPNKNVKGQSVEVSVQYAPYLTASSAVLTVEDETGKPFEFSVGATVAGDTYNYVFTSSSENVGKTVYDTIKISFPDNKDQLGSGKLYLVVHAISGQFTDEKVVIGNFDNLEGKIRVLSTEAFGEAGTGKAKIEVSEPTVGTFEKGSKIVIKLSDGFIWGNTVDTITQISGPDPKSATNVEIKPDGKELTITFNTQSASTRYIFTFNAYVKVADKDIAAKGDVTAYVIGASPSTVVVGKYGDYQVKVSGDDQQELWAGRKVEDYQRVGKIVLEEYLPASLVQGRTVTITLPSGAYWLVNKDKDNKDITGKDDAGNFKLKADSDGGYIVDYPGNKAVLEFVRFEKVSSDESKYRVAVFKVKTASTGAGKTVIPVQKVAVNAGFKDAELKVTVGGPAGASGEATIAKVKQFVEVTAQNKTEVFIGARDQAAGEIVIKELYPGMIRSGEKITISVGDYTNRFDGATAEVVEGDLVLGKLTFSNNDKTIEIPVRKASTKESTIVIKNIKVTVDRTAPQGDEDSTVGGKALFDYGDKAVTAYKIVTPADRTRPATAKFTIDSLKYTVDGQEKTMDVAPFIKDNRTFVPVKYVAEALGVKDADIIWNPYAKSVTIFKGDRVVQVKIGSKTLLVNGAAIEMDTAATIKDARTVLPIAWVAKALNVEYTWNDAERSVEFNYLAQ
ncbi:MAG: copper amine oxidase N-terminal domain-containing protein [Hydrogenibacillus sp.]|nr:copper amine oxidase N-terminal domain-containing protein [Hydrogenibacillus sp.]